MERVVPLLHVLETRRDKPSALKQGITQELVTGGRAQLV